MWEQSTRDGSETQVRTTAGTPRPWAPSCGLHPVSRAFPGRVASHPAGRGPVSAFSPTPTPGARLTVGAYVF